MTRERTDLDVGGLLGAWMNEAAPASIPVLVLEEAFARTMTASQVRVYPWQRVGRRSARRQRLTLLSLAATATLLVGLLGLRASSAAVPASDRRRSPPRRRPRSPRRPPFRSPTPSPSPFPATPIVPIASIAAVKPQSLATDGTVLWLLSENGSVARIDPATNTLGTGVPTGATTDLSQGISVGANGVWVTEWNKAKLYRVDPTSLKVVATIPVGLAPKGVLATEAAVWVADTHDGKVLRIDPATNKVVATITVGPAGNSGPNWLGSGFGSIWTGVPNASTVVRIDPITNAVQATITVPVEVTACGGFAFTETDVWMPSCGRKTIARIDPATNVVAGVVRPDGVASTPAVIDGAAWVSLDTTPAAPGYLARLSSERDAVDLALSPGPDFGGGGDLVVAVGSAWVIDGGNDRVLRLPLAGFTPD